MTRRPQTELELEKRKLVLVRHAAVELLPDVPAPEWPLTEEGRRAAAELARSPELAGVVLVATSPEGKARDTAAPIDAPQRVEPDLREVARPGTPILPRSRYVDLVDRYFEGERIEDWEPRDVARERIVACVGRLLEEAEGDLVVVSHGLVLSLYLAWLQDLARPNLDEWSAMPLPSLAVVDPQARRVLTPWRGR